MKTFELTVGLVQLAAAALMGLLGLRSESVALIVLYAVCGTTNSCLGVTNVLDALFGAGGLVCDVDRVVQLRRARKARREPPRTRCRLTDPSAALRRRGARARLRPGSRYDRFGRTR